MGRVPGSDVWVRFEPLEPALPEPTGGYHVSQFSGTWTDTLELLRREVGMLGADEVVLAVDAKRGNMRQDGGIRADARVESPGIAVYIDKADRGPMRMTCSRFRGGSWGRRALPGWQANIRAVALGLESLRRVERYGIADDGQQYRGWQALPPGGPIVLGPTMTMDQAAAMLATDEDELASRMLAGDKELVADLYREHARRTHPDLGGDPDEFRRITQARDLLLTG